MQTTNVVVDLGPVASGWDEPITVAELKAHLRLNTSAEDDLLELYISTARQQFEHSTDGRICVPSLYEQHLTEWPEVIRLCRGPVTEVTSVAYYNQDDELTDLEDFTTDLATTPALVSYYPTFSWPAVSQQRIRPIIVSFTAGFTEVPSDVRLAIKLLAAHYYANRESHLVDDLKELPFGFGAIARRYGTGLNGF